MGRFASPAPPERRGRSPSGRSSPVRSPLRPLNSVPRWKPQEQLPAGAADELVADAKRAVASFLEDHCARAGRALLSLGNADALARLGTLESQVGKHQQAAEHLASAMADIDAHRQADRAVAGLAARLDALEAGGAAAASGP